VDAFLIAHPPNLRYLFNFSGSAGMALCRPEGTRLIVDSRYIEQAQEECSGVECVRTPDSLMEELSRSLADSAPGRLALEAQRLPWETILRMESWGLPIDLVASYNRVESLRIIKDKTELARMRRAFKLAEEGFGEMRNRLSPGMTETAAAGELEAACRKLGAEGMAFDTIVASGRRSSLPHAGVTQSLIGFSEILLIDFGIRLDGYCTDLTRVLLPSRSRPPKAFQVVREARDAALSQIRPGASSAQVDAAARGVIEAAGFGDSFGHSAGHGLGLEVHELPGINRRDETILRPGMVFTIEPGVYLPERYGVRLEDVVVVTDSGFELLSSLPLEMSLGK
jgi:Xaa-Pro aminopeptidase